MDTTNKISIVIPVYNEKKNLLELAKEICEVVERNKLSVEVIMVDDGSQDGSWNVIKDFSKKDDRFKGIRFPRNFGKAAALAAGFAAVTGDIIVQLDSDLQDDPKEIPRFLAEIESGYDIVNGWKKERHDPLHKVWPSKVFNFLTSYMTGIKLHDHNCGFKCLRVEVAKSIQLYGELHRFIPAMAYARGFRVNEIVVNHRLRKYGHTKYGSSRFIKGFLDLMTVLFLQRFGWRPQHLLGGFGIFSFLIGSGGLTYLFIRWCLGYRPVGTPLVVSYSIAALSIGIQMIALGFLAEIIVAMNIRDKDSFTILERTYDCMPSDPMRQIEGF